MLESTDNRRHFIVKHGLDAFELLPNYIWNTSKGESEIPHRYMQVKAGNRWIGFAYTTSDNHERPLSRVTGFYECVKEAVFVELPQVAKEASPGSSHGWMIEGKPCGDQPMEPVAVEPIDDILGKTLWKNQAIVPITEEDFDKIRKHALSRQFDTKSIPLLGREPENEQEVLAVIAACHNQLGIEKIIRVRQAFPDMLIQFQGSTEKVHVELELYSESFFSHGHDGFVSDFNFKDGHPVAVLCWIDNLKKVKEGKKDLNQYVRRVYELQSLIRENKKMEW